MPAFLPKCEGLLVDRDRAESVNYDQLNILEVLMMLASRQAFQILSDQINPEKFGLHGLFCMKGAAK